MFAWSSRVVHLRAAPRPVEVIKLEGTTFPRLYRRFPMSLPSLPVRTVGIEHHP